MAIMDAYETIVVFRAVAVVAQAGRGCRFTQVVTETAGAGQLHPNRAAGHRRTKTGMATAALVGRAKRVRPDLDTMVDGLEGMHRNRDSRTRQRRSLTRHVCSCTPKPRV